MVKPLRRLKSELTASGPTRRGARWKIIYTFSNFDSENYSEYYLKIESLFVFHIVISSGNKYFILFWFRNSLTSDKHHVNL